MRVEPQGEMGFAVLAEARSGWDEVRPTRAILLGPDGHKRDLSLEPAGPGRYRARLAALAPGAYVVQVTQQVGPGAEPRGESGWVAPYPAEFRESGVDGPLLGQVAAAGGGRVLDDAAQVMEASPRSASARWPAWSALLLLAALLWPLEIASRRLSVPDAATWLAVARSKAAIPGAKVPASRESSHVTPGARTAERLLERKRAFRETRNKKPGG